jgi:hypothetical protein
VVTIPPEMALAGTGVCPKVGSCTAMALEAAGEMSAHGGRSHRRGPSWVGDRQAPGGVQT